MNNVDHGIPKQLTLPHMLISAATSYSDATAVNSGGKLLSYSELCARVLRIAAVLRAKGINKGDHCAVWLPNSASWIEIALGISCAGAVIVPLNTRLKVREVEFMLVHADVKLVLAAEQFNGRQYANELRAVTFPHPLEIVGVLIDGALNEWEVSIQEVRGESIDEARKSALTVDQSAIAEIMFTSGTTGRPKGAMIPHKHIILTYDIYARYAEIRKQDRYLIIAPMSHSFGFKAGVIVSLLRGATIYPLALFKAEEVLDIVKRESISVMGGPPTIFTSLLEIDDRDGSALRSLHSVVLGGNMIEPQLVRTLREKIGIETVVSAYGMTETTALVTMCRSSDDLERIARTSGQAVPGIDMRCIDDAGNDVGLNVNGEIAVRGDHIFYGYYKDSQRTAEAWTSDGWFRTGDIGYLDDEHYIIITDRKKYMFITGGFNCYPAEIESVIERHPAVKEAAVRGVPDKRMGAVCKAYIVLKKPCANFESSSFISWCKENMADYKVPRSVVILEELPRNALGKVEKFALPV